MITSVFSGEGKSEVSFHLAKEMANAGNNIDITLLSSGIYEAMITTVGGLIVGIIAMFAYNYLVSRVDDVANTLEAQTLSFMDLKN